MKINTTLKVIFLVICYPALAQETKENTFVNTEKDMKGFLTEKMWETTQIFGTDIDSYQLKEFIPRKFAGYLTTFADTMTFTSQYTAPCGNDEELGRMNTVGIS